MNAATAYTNYLILKAYREAVAREKEICPKTGINDPAHIQAIMDSCEAFLVVEDYGLTKEAGITYFNVWD